MAEHAGHHTGRRILIGIGIVVAVLVLGGVALVLWGGNPPEEVTVEDAQERFQPSTTDQQDATTATTGVQAFTLPAQGVFLAEGEGFEDTSFPPVTEYQGPEMPVTVTWQGDDCYEYRIDYNTNHWQSWDFCLTDEGLSEHGGITFQRRDYGAVKVDSEATFVCDPPAPVLAWDMLPGEQLDASCAGTNSVIEGDTTSAGTNTFIGIETVDVGGEEVDAYHVRGEREVSGAQVGTERWDMWLDARTGMPLHRSHDIQVATDTPFGDIDYHEVTDWALTSLDPTG